MNKHSEVRTLALARKYRQEGQAIEALDFVEEFVQACSR